MLENKIKEAAELIRKAKYAVAFTGAGISVESGIPPFRGMDGLWKKYDPIFLEIGYFKKKPLASWMKIKEVFYDMLKDAKPNLAHQVIAKMCERGFVESIITQNIDNLHQEAGSRYVYELHGTHKQLVCTECQSEYHINFADFNFLPPTCFVCKGILKPDMVFFNEPIPQFAKSRSFAESEKSDVFIIVGANAEVYPANEIPVAAKNSGATIIEVNIKETHFTNSITDVFLKGKATEVFGRIGELLYL
jgi:NAD-dependent deacetylase